MFKETVFQKAAAHHHHRGKSEIQGHCFSHHGVSEVLLQPQTSLSPLTTAVTQRSKQSVSHMGPEGQCPTYHLLLSPSAETSP